MATEDKKPMKAVNAYMKYSGIGFQIAGGVGLGVLIGWFIDKQMGNEKPIFTAVLALVFLFATLFLVVRSLLNDDKK